MLLEVMDNRYRFIKWRDGSGSKIYSCVVYSLIKVSDTWTKFSAKIHWYKKMYLDIRLFKGV